MAQAQEVNLPEPFITNSITTLPPHVATPVQTQTSTPAQPTIPFRERVQQVLNNHGSDEVTLKRELRRLLVPKRGEKTPKPAPAQTPW